jgi:hypothetical protein
VILKKLRYKDIISSKIHNNIKTDEDVYNIDFNNFVFGRGCKNLMSLLRRVSYIKNEDAKRYFYYNLFNMKNFNYTYEYLVECIKLIDNKYINILINVLNNKNVLSDIDLLMIQLLSSFIIKLVKNKKHEDINFNNFNKLLKNVLNSDMSIPVIILKYYLSNINHFKDIKLKHKAIVNLRNSGLLMKYYRLTH